MNVEIALLITAIILLIAVLIVTIFVTAGKKGEKNKDTQDIERFKNDILAENRVLRQELLGVTQGSIKNMGDMLRDNQISATQSQQDKLTGLEQRLKTFSLENEQKLDLIRTSVEQKLNYIQQDNNKKLDQMREVVDEKLQKTLDEKMTRSFALVNERLEQVYKGLGEMQTLAVGVGDLKKVLSNVKTRGILGELQLSNILKEILSPEQYAENIVTKKGSKMPVEFAVKLPSDNNSFIYLPIDSKFPGDTYANLKNAYDSGNKEEIATATKQLILTIKAEARDISTKYIDPPNTTDFAIMFLPFEGLYAEVVNKGLVEALQNEYKVNIAGPSTMAALLNSLQMGFKTLAVQKRSTEVWQVLNGVKTEFEKFNTVLELTQQRINQANDELDKLVGVRSRQIQKKLSNITTIEDTKALPQ